MSYPYIMEKFKDFKPRRFAGLVNMKGLEDWGDFSGTFEVDQIVKGRIYEERDPRYSEGHRLGVVVDDNGCCWFEEWDSFKKNFVEVHDINILGDAQDKWRDLSNLRSGPVFYDHKMNHKRDNPFEPVEGLEEYKTIEHCYQFRKAIEAGDYRIAQKVVTADSGYQAKAYSKNIIWRDITERQWNNRKFLIMKNIMTAHYTQKQNQSRIDLLLATGFNPLTHKHATVNMGKWEVEFPKLLMEIRTKLENGTFKVK